MSASIVVSTRDLQALVDYKVAILTLTKVELGGITLQLESIIDGKVYLSLLRRDTTEVLHLFVTEGVGFQYIL